MGEGRVTLRAGDEMRGSGGGLAMTLRGGVCAAPLAALLVTAAPAFAQSAVQTQAQPAAAKTAAPPRRARALTPADDPPEVSEIVVTAGKTVYQTQPGAVAGDIEPEVQLSPAQIQSYGVSTVTELLDELAPQTRSDRGRGGGSPVVLLNGRRISGFNEIRDIPTEAILRVDILPEEVALKYGFTADQRVVNIVLRRRFRAETVDVRAGTPTEGGSVTGRRRATIFACAATTASTSTSSMTRLRT
jgi:iron complex outermembrane receptor protein